MLSSQTLERVSVAYRKGYHHGYDGNQKFLKIKPDYIKPFANTDYEKGYEAGANDALWAAIHSGSASKIPNKERKNHAN